MKPFLLIDADVLAYSAASSVEKIVLWDEDCCTTTASLAEAFSAFEGKLTRVLEDLNATDFALCFSDSHENNFRKKLYPAYKSNRSKKARPVALKFLKDKIINEEYQKQVFMLPGLEADDVLGILATSEGFKNTFQKIIVSVDKDMKTLPCYYFDMNKGYEDGEAVVTVVTEPDADFWFLTQALTGDSTDGYPGCPKYGAVTAARLLNVAKRGPESDIIKDAWPAVVSAYEKAGFGEEYALTMARLARILRADDWDFQKQEVKLWNPSL